jgi:hypothetical protein
LFLEFAGPVRLERLAKHRLDLGLLRTEQFGEDLRRVAVPRQGRLKIVNLTGFSLA